jgi:hypothetical protein
MRIPAVFLVGVLALPMAADEGMWLFNQFPKDQVKKSYSFDVTGQFLENLRLASLRIGANAGSLVSANGLILTDRGTVADCVAKLKPTPNSAQPDYVKDGFYAATQAEELPCPGLEASVLVGLEDVTSQVKEAAPAKEAPKNAKAAAAAEKTTEAMQKRNAAIARLEKACAEKTGDTCTVVKLSSGERYDLYRYQKLSDLRLVFAPELAMANGRYSRTSATSSTSLSCARTGRASRPRPRTTSSGAPTPSRTPNCCSWQAVRPPRRASTPVRNSSSTVTPRCR